MSSPRNLPDPATYDRLPSPFPEGWYFIASRQALLKAGLLQKTWMGEEIIIWCDDNGQVCVAQAHCPHLGAHLGPDSGGRVCGGRLVCPFHGYEYDAAGQCVATPYADPPRTARLRVFETHEINGLIFAWWGINGREPQWRLPPDTVERDGWSSPTITTLRFPGHPQETTENSVDLAHLRYVHGYDSVSRVWPISVDGPRLESRFDFKRLRKIAKIATFNIDLSADTTIYGLGYSFVAIREHSIGMDMRLWVLATPVDGALIDMSLVSQVREIRKPKRWIAGLGFLPTRTPRPPYEPIYRGQPAPGRSARHYYLATQAIPLTAPPVPFRRRDYGVPGLLRSILPLSRFGNRKRH